MSDSFVTTWIVTHQASLFLWFPREEFLSGLPFPLPGYLLNPETEPAPPSLADRFFNHWTTWKYDMCTCVLNRFSHVQLFATSCTIACQAPLPWDSPGKNTGVGCHALLQGDSLEEDYSLEELIPKILVQENPFSLAPILCMDSDGTWYHQAIKTCGSEIQLELDRVKKERTERGRESELASEWILG